MEKPISTLALLGHGDSVCQNRLEVLKAEREWYEPGRKNSALTDNPCEHTLAYAHVRSYYVKNIEEKLAHVKTPNILDVGVGDGTTRAYFRKDAHFYGIDVSRKPLMKLKRDQTDVDCIEADAVEMPFASETFDAVYCLGLLHHIVGQGDLLDRVVGEMARTTRSNGFVFALEPNVLYPSGLAMNVVQRAYPQMYARMGFVPHERCLSPGSLKKSFLKAGLCKVSFKACGYATNRFPVSLQKATYSIENKCSENLIFSRFGWWTCVKGEKA